MKILKSLKNVNSLPHQKSASPDKNAKIKLRRSEFQKEEILFECMDDADGYTCLFPKHGIFWDDGYADIDKENVNPNL